MAHCSKVFVCNSPDKSDSKCSTKRVIPRALALTRMQGCFRYNWLNQNEHVKEYNWSQLNAPF